MALKCRSSHRSCSMKKVFLESSKNSQKNTCARVSFLIKQQTLACNFIKKRLWQRCFPVNFVKFLRTPFLQNTSGRLLLEMFSVKQQAQACNFTKKIYHHRCFPVNFHTIFSYPRNIFNDCYCLFHKFQGNVQ